MTNYVDFFRYNDKYDDVFTENGHYLYVEAEPFNWPYLLACREWTDNGYTLKPSSSWDGISTERLQTLKKAPDEIAKKIIALEWVAQAEEQDRYLDEEERLDLDVDEITWIDNEICI